MGHSSKVYMLNSSTTESSKILDFSLVQIIYSELVDFYSYSELIDTEVKFLNADESSDLCSCRSLAFGYIRQNECGRDAFVGLQG